MDTKDKKFENLKLSCLDYTRFVVAAIRFGDPQKIEEIADEMRGKLYELSCCANRINAAVWNRRNTVKTVKRNRSERLANIWPPSDTDVLSIGIYRDIDTGEYVARAIQRDGQKRDIPLHDYKDGQPDRVRKVVNADARCGSVAPICSPVGPGYCRYRKTTKPDVAQD